MRRAVAVHSRGYWPEDAALGTVTLAYIDRHRRRIRLVADSGETFLLDLPRARHLVDGDGLELEARGAFPVCSAPAPPLETFEDQRAAFVTLPCDSRHPRLPPLGHLAQPS